MKLLLTVVIGIAAVLVALVAVSFLLPSTYDVRRSTVIQVPAARVSAEVADFRTWPHWGVWWEKDDTIRQEFSGTPGSIGSRIDWTGKDGPGAMTLVGLDLGRSLDLELTFGEGEAMRSRTRFDFAERDGGTDVTWSMQGDLGMNPLWRWMGLFLDRMAGPDFEHGLANLKARLEAKS